MKFTTLLRNLFRPSPPPKPEQQADGLARTIYNAILAQACENDPSFREFIEQREEKRKGNILKEDNEPPPFPRAA